MAPQEKQEADGTDPEEEEVETETEAETETETGEEKSKEKELTLEEALEQLDATRIALKKANRESAKRRLELKGLKTKKPEEGEKEQETEKARKDLEAAQKQLADVLSENRGLKLRGTIRSKVAELKLSLFSEEALEDATTRVQAALDGDEYDDEDILQALKEVAKSRPYLFRKPEKLGGEGAGGTDAAKKGTSDVIVTEEEEKDVARRFNITPK